MPVDPVAFASLLCSRLCHDLLSPIGALNNGLELLEGENDPDMRRRCFELLEQSARISAEKLKYFRLAFGAAGGFGDMVATAEAHAAISGLIGEAARIELAWLVHDDMLPKAAVKVMLNLALIGIDGLVRGGRLDIGAERHDGVTEIVVRAEGDRLAVDEELVAVLTGARSEEAITARTAAAWMTQRIVATGGGDIQASRDGDRVLLIGAFLRA